MKIYNYNNLLEMVREIKTNKIIAESERTMCKKSKVIEIRR